MQTGAGGTSLAVAACVKDYMLKNNVTDELILKYLNISA